MKTLLITLSLVLLMILTFSALTPNLSTAEASSARLFYVEKTRNNYKAYFYFDNKRIRNAKCSIAGKRGISSESLFLNRTSRCLITGRKARKIYNSKSHRARFTIHNSRPQIAVFQVLRRR